MLLERDNRINNKLLKIDFAQHKAYCIEDDINGGDGLEKDKIKGMILFLLIKYNRNYCLTEDQIICEIINLGKNIAEQASDILSRLEEEEGSEYCKKFQGGKFVYDLMELPIYTDTLCRMNPLSQMHILCMSQTYNTKKN